jgi:hypothetical protein
MFLNKRIIANNINEGSYLSNVKKAFPVSQEQYNQKRYVPEQQLLLYHTSKLLKENAKL